MASIRAILSSTILKIQLLYSVLMILLPENRFLFALLIRNFVFKSFLFYIVKFQILLYNTSRKDIGFYKHKKGRAINAV